MQRVLARFRPDPNRAAPATRTHRRSIHAARVLQARLRAPRAASITSLLAQALRPAISPDRAVPVAVAGILAVAAFLAYLPVNPGGPVGGPDGDGPAPRIAIGGFDEGWEQEDITWPEVEEPAGVAGRGIGPAAPGPIDGEFVPVEIPVSSPLALTGPFLDDGTLLAGVAPDTTVPDGSGLMRTYRVKAGDTLVGVAQKFDVSMMTIWWANKIGSKEALKVGQTLLIPPVSGLVVKVTDADTLESLAAKHKVTTQSILDANQLDQPVLVVGQQLMIPGAVGEAIPTPKPTPKPTVRPRTSTSSGGTVRTPTTYSGGAFAWPVVGGDNYISQYFRYGHYGLDIAADHGSRVRAAAAGTVTFAGWKSNGGGYQVWIAHGGGLYTTYNHMSGVSVGRGQQVAKGQQVGRIGCTGYCSGPHLHFEVWRGPIWDGGSRVNPLRYY